MFILTILHSIGVTIAVIMALFEIETIIASGPFLSAFSLLLAVLAYRRKYAISLYYALATPTVSLFCFAAINLLDWGPSEAKVPVGTFLAIFGLINIPFGIVSLRELKRTKTQCLRQGPFQFSIAAIMGLTLVVALSLSLIKTLGDSGAILAGILCHFSLLTYVLRRFHKNDLPVGEN